MKRRGFLLGSLGAAAAVCSPSMARPAAAAVVPALPPAPFITNTPRYGIPFTSAGIDAVKAAVLAVLAKAEACGHIAPGFTACVTADGVVSVEAVLEGEIRKVSIPVEVQF